MAFNFGKKSSQAGESSANMAGGYAANNGLYRNGVNNPNAGMRQDGAYNYNGYPQQKAQGGFPAQENGGTLSEQERLQREIAKTEKDIEEIYKEIGRLYYEQHVKEEQNGEMSGFFSQIAAAQEKIEECRMKILRENGRKKCEKCGREIPLDALFCNFCGQRQAPLSVGEANTCKNCGAPMEEGQLFCIRCGQKAEPTKIKAKPVCSRCGAELQPGVLFCEQCGQRVADGVSAPDLTASKPEAASRGFAPEPEAASGGFAPKPEAASGGFAPKPEAASGGYMQNPTAAAQNDYTLRPEAAKPAEAVPKASVQPNAAEETAAVQSSFGEDSASYQAPVQDVQTAYAENKAAREAPIQDVQNTYTEAKTAAPAAVPAQDSYASVGEPPWPEPLSETAPLDSPDSFSAKNERQPAAADAAKIVPEVRFCTECGYRLNAGEIYCTNCGRRV